MATLRTRTVKTSGGDYTSLAGWEAGEQGNLVTLDEIRQAECYAMLDLSVPVFAGWTTDATRYIHVIVPASNRHLGKPDSTSYRLASDSFSWAADVQVPNVIFEGLQVLTGSNGNPQGGFHFNAAINFGTCEVRECVFDWRTTPPPYASVGMEGATGGTFKVRNGSHASGAGITDFVKHQSGAGYTTYAYNLSAYSTYTGGFGRLYNQDGNGTMVCKNCVGAYQTASSNSCFNGTISGNNNCSSDATAPGTGSVTNQTPSFVSTANGDLHLQSGDTVAKGAGADLSADSNYAFTVDIDGQTRATPWEIGADQLTIAASSDVAAAFFAANAFSNRQFGLRR